MKPMKSIFAASIFAIAGMANAANIGSFTFSNAIAYTLEGESGAGTGVAMLDDSGMLIINETSTTTLYSFYFTESGIYTLSGIWDGINFTPISGTSVINTCSSNIGGCPTTLPTPTLPLDPSITISGSITTAGGVLILSTNSVIDTYTFTPAAVPVPATAWLFGSGLAALVGAARRKSKSA